MNSTIPFLVTELKVASHPTLLIADEMWEIDARLPASYREFHFHMKKGQTLKYETYTVYAPYLS